jgi:hypothetical protein
VFRALLYELVYTRNLILQHWPACGDGGWWSYSGRTMMLLKADSTSRRKTNAAWAMVPMSAET